MALAENEKWVSGLVRDTTTMQIVMTTNKTGAKWEGGFLRDPDGRLVVVRA